jgi:hypothetical protein
VVNTAILKNNPFHQFYHITTFGVDFYHPPGLTVRSLFALDVGPLSSLKYKQRSCAMPVSSILAVYSGSPSVSVSACWIAALGTIERALSLRMAFVVKYLLFFVLISSSSSVRSWSFFLYVS